MRKFIYFTLFFLLLSTVTFQQAIQAKDVTGHQMEMELRYWMERNVIRADAQSNVKPDKAITRGEFASFLSRALHLPHSDAYTFRDLKPNTTLTLEIQSAAGAGLLSGYPDGTFRPNELITRQQMAGMIYKAFRHMGIVSKLDQTNTVGKFQDYHKISANFHIPVSVAADLNIIRGEHRNNKIYFKPKEHATIAHAAAFLFRMDAVATALKDKPEEPQKPNKPAPPLPDIYKVSSIANGLMKPTDRNYLNFEEALKAYNASSSIKVITKQNKVIKMKAGRAYGADNPTQVTTLYRDASFKEPITYIQKGREMGYVGSSEHHVIVEVAGSKYYAKHAEVDLVPAELVTGYDFYTVQPDRTLVHHPFDHVRQRHDAYQVGPAADSMVVNKRYRSLDGVHFTEIGSNKQITYYPYFQFQSVRLPSSYSAEELDRYITYALEQREKLNPTRYKDLRVKSKLIGMGSYLKEMEKKHRINALFILATAIHESDYGISANAQKKNNLFGIKVFDSSPESGEAYASPERSIDAFIERYMNLNYANPLGAHTFGAAPGNKAVGFNVKYASDPHWGSKIAGHMWRIDSYLGGREYKKAKLGTIAYKGNVGVNIRTSPEVRPDNKLFTYKPKDPGYNEAFGYPIVIVDETTNNIGERWYKIVADLNSTNEHGWIRSDLVKLMTH